MPDDVVPAESSAERIQERLQKLKIRLHPQIAYRLETVFAKTTGWGANAEIKRRARLIGLVEPTLLEMLLPNEQVLYVAKGVQYSLAESYFMGAWLAAILNQTVFVLTNLRLLLIRSKGSGKPLDTYWVIYYSEIELLQSTWTGILKLRLKDRTNYKFTGFSRLDRQAIPTIFQDAIDQYRQLGFRPAVSQSRENLCTHCLQVVPRNVHDCNHCGATYWTPGQLALRSLIFPSWGDLCMKHYGIAGMELFGYAISWIAAINALADANVERGITIAIMIFIFEHPFDAIMTYCVAKKGLNPLRGPDPDRVQQTDAVEEVIEDVEFIEDD